MTSTIDLHRRRFLAGGLAGMAALAIPVPPARAAAPKTVTVLTAYPDELVSRFEAAFEKAHPDYRLQVIWRQAREALAYLRGEGREVVDVYWSASPRTFALLAEEGRLAPLAAADSGLPDRVGKSPLVADGGLYRAFEIAGFGFVVNPAALAARRVPVPRDWDELADPRYAGLIALPSPARVGFAPPIVEIVLQAWGWERGWALWSEIAGNAAPMERGNTFITDETSSGRYPIGITIDFFTASAIANGAPLSFQYPRHGGVNPAHVAVTARAPNPAGAQAFARFLLSAGGQKILAHPDIRRLPVRPEVYRGLPAGQYDPFAAAAQGGLDFDAALAAPRLPLSTALFDRMLGAGHAELVALWARVHSAEAAGRDVAEARRHLCLPPISEAEAADPALRRLLAERSDRPAPAAKATTATPADAVLARWQSHAEIRRIAAAAVLARAGA